MTPAALWKGFSDETADAEIVVLKDETAGGIHTRAFYFSALKSGNAAVRCFVTIRRPAGHTALPAAIILCPEDRRASYEKVVLSQKCAAVYVDYEGAMPGKERFTIYPPAFGYAEMSEYAGAGKDFNALFKIKKSATETPWYVWTAIVRRAIAVIKNHENTDRNRIGLIGVRSGANIGWKIIGSTKLVCAAALIEAAGREDHGIVYSETDTRYKQGASDENYMLSLSTAAYIPNVTCPVLVHSGTNGANNMFDRTSFNMERLPVSAPLLFSVSPRGDKELDYKQAQNLKKWVAGFVGGGLEFPPQPQTSAEIKDGKLEIRVRAGLPGKIKGVTVYYSYATTAPARRNWYGIPAAETDDGAFSAKADIYYPGKHIYYFAVADYKDGFAQASFADNIIPEITVPPAQPQRVLYDARVNGFDCFTAETGERIHTQKQPLSLQKCPGGIVGITAPKGNIVTYKAGDLRFLPPSPDAGLVFTLYSEKDRTVKIKLTEYSGGEKGRQYSGCFKLLGAEGWQKIVCACNDFKTALNVPLTSWSNIVKMSIKTDGGVLVSNIIWV